MNDQQLTWQPVVDKRLLKSLAKKGHFTFPPKFGGGFQICEKVNGKDQPNHFEVWLERYNMTIRFRIKYIDGSIYPYLYMLIPAYGYVQKYDYHY